MTSFWDKVNAPDPDDPIHALTDKEKWNRVLAEQTPEEIQEQVDKEAGKKYGDLIPDMEEIYDRSPEDAELEDFLKGIGIIEAYTRWCGKSTPKQTNSGESIMVSCPKPDHADENPSAWLNSNDNLWFCGGCQEGGDVYDIAAYRFGYGVPEYKEGADFVNLRRDMALDMGFVIVESEGKEYFEAPESPEITESDIAEDSEESSLADVIPMYHPGEEPFATKERHDLNWHDILSPEGTFLHKYMLEATSDSFPEAFHFWNAVMGMGMACGRDVEFIGMGGRPMYLNWYICLYGSTGVGKSQSANLIRQVIHGALPWDGEEPGCTGTKTVTAASPEAFIDQLVSVHDDEPYAVRGLYDQDELSAVTNRSKRSGNDVRPLLVSLFDNPPRIAHTTRGRGEIVAIDPFVSILVTTQPRTLKDNLTQMDADSGFMNRIIWAWSTAKEPQFRTPSKDVDALVDRLGRIRSWASMKRRIDFDPSGVSAAQAKWEEHILPIRRALGKAHADVGDEGEFEAPDYLNMMARSELYIWKLAASLAVDEKSEMITGDMVERAFTIFPHMETMAQLVTLGLRQNELDDAIRKVVDKVNFLKGRDKEWPTVRVTNQNLHLRAEMFNMGVDFGIKLGMLEKVTIQQDGSGRPKTVLRTFKRKDEPRVIGD